MKKKTILFLLLILSTIAFTTCKKDSNNTTGSSNISKDSSNKSIVGTWELTHYHEVEVDSTTIPITINTSDSNLTHNKAPILKFNSDSSCFSYPDYQNPLNPVPGSYSLIGNDTISFTFGPGPPPEKPSVKLNVI